MRRREDEGRDKPLRRAGGHGHGSLDARAGRPGGTVCLQGQFPSLHSASARLSEEKSEPRSS